MARDDEGLEPSNNLGVALVGDRGFAPPISACNTLAPCVDKPLASPLAARSFRRARAE